MGIAIGWRHNDRLRTVLHRDSLSISRSSRSQRFLKVSTSRNREPHETKSHETTEYGGFLLMMDTVPRSRIMIMERTTCACFYLYPSDRLADQARSLAGPSGSVPGSLARNSIETRISLDPAIGILGATQLNGGAVATLLVLAFACPSCSAPPTSTSGSMRTSPGSSSGGRSPSSTHGSWSLSDDPMTWFYYNWGFSGFPIVVFLWWTHRSRAPAHQGLEKGASEVTLHWA